MEPPPKRLRILQSVEVDEENPDYINAKQKQQKKFKGTLESIFAKYENMHESMSDEIDMKTNKLVVDRGHLRRLARQANQKDTMLAALGLGAEQEPERTSEGEEGEEEEESEDELAPTQCPKSSNGPTKNNHQPVIRPSDNPASAIAQAGAQSIPTTPNAAANLLHLVQFPQTPAGEQALTTFCTTLNQTIQQAVQQAVAPLFSSILPNTPNVQLPFVQAFPAPAPTTPVIAGDKVTPAADPKWFFPPLSVGAREPQTAQSSPIPAPVDTLAVGAGVDEGAAHNNSQQKQDRTELEMTTEDPQSLEIQAPATAQPDLGSNNSSKPTIRRTTPRMEIQSKRKGGTKKYHFTEEDDVYISKRKILHSRTWLEIRNSREKWRDWPLHPFQQRWRKHLRAKNLHLVDVTGTAQEGDHTNPDTGEPSPTQSHHLPTPSSSVHEDRVQETVEPSQPRRDDLISSSAANFDDDELELLSLDGTDQDKEQLPATNDDDIFYHAPEDVVLPSVEMTEFIDEDALQQDLIENAAMEDIIPTAPEASVAEVKPEPPLSSPINRRNQKPLPITFQAVPDSDADETEDDVGLVRTDTNTRPRSTSLDLVGNDDEQAPTTPHIKRESSTPGPAAFLRNKPSLQTPQAAQNQSSFHSSTSKSSSKLDRKAFLKQIKQSWTKKSTPAAKTVNKRKSFHTLPRKRAWRGDEESEDELAL